MLVVDHTSSPTTASTDVIELQELEYIAFSGQHDIAHGIFRGIPKGERIRFANKYILSEVVYGGVEKLRKFLAASAEEHAREEKEFVDDTVGLFIRSARASRSFPRELFETLLLWGDELTRLSLLQEALRYYEEALEMGVNRYPDLSSRTLVAKAGVLTTLGKFREAQTLLALLAERPYIITDRNVIPEVIFHLGRESLLRGDIDYYKALLFRGLRHFYMNIDDRRLFVEQIRKTYRRSWKILVARNVPAADKVLYALHRLYFGLHDVKAIRSTRMSAMFRLGLLGYVYWLTYLRHGTIVQRSPRQSAPSVSLLVAGNGRADRPVVMETRRRRNILVTRAMGGIGDLLMMTPGFHALKQKYPHDEIHLAIPRRYFPVFEGNEDVHLIDIERNTFQHTDYRKWFNFTDCPASRVESRTAPKVRRGRIDVFAGALGIGALHRQRMDRNPRYFVSKEEREFQADFWHEHGLTAKRVIGVQLHSDEVYRNYPHMQQLVKLLILEYHVLVFDAEAIHGFDDERVTKVAGMPLRRAFALAAGCDAIVAPDSAFVHVAAALRIPCVALYGPIDGKVRTEHYPHCVYLDARQTLGCVPCWRNDRIPCKLTNMRTSICMGDIAPGDIRRALQTMLTIKECA